MELILSKNIFDWFESNNISFHNRFLERLKIGNKVYFLDDLELEPYVGFHAGNNLFEQGFMSYSNSNLPTNIKVGRYCSLAGGIGFISYNHPYACLSTSIFTHDRRTDLTVRALRDFVGENAKMNFVPNPQKPPVQIENDVWIGQNSALLAGIRIKTGSIVAANSVVTKDVEPYSIVGGNPAKLIKYRFPQEIISSLLESEWWNYKFTDFRDLNIGDPSKFLESFANRKNEIQIFPPTKIKLLEAPI